MTDNYNPIELSWDWHAGSSPPTIRFSFEPIGMKAGTVEDPFNIYAPRDFKAKFLEEFPDTDLQWFNHFETYFGVSIEQSSLDTHQSNIFWAFDLNEEFITSKAYFFPGPTAYSKQKTNFEVIRDAIRTAPFSTTENLTGLDAISKFVDEHQSSHLEVDMLAIDLVKPQKSRFKVYFRSRETSFQSVYRAVTLGGRILEEKTDAAIQKLRRLWDLLFQQ